LEAGPEASTGNNLAWAPNQSPSGRSGPGGLLQHRSAFGWINRWGGGLCPLPPGWSGMGDSPRCSARLPDGLQRGDGAGSRSLV